jgi:orotidine-5'-phosphate decarboxylase
MTRKELTDQIFLKKSYLCIGLDTDITKIPKHLLSFSDPVFEFNRRIIDATKDYCVSYKINTAFYEASGVKGWETMERTADYIPPSHFKIADAKRGDIGNTSAQYAKAFFETLKFDAITVAPYMGEDSIKPFLEHKDKWTIILGLTSNTGAKDFELKKILSTNHTLDEGIHIAHNDVNFLYETVLQTTSKWGSSDNTMYVVGATQPDEFVNIRSITPEHFYLVPGVGAQGGSLKDISQRALIKDCGLLVNVSRAVIYASNSEDFADEASIIAQRYADEMSIYLG